VFARIAQSPLKLNLSTVLGDAVKELATFLRKQNRQLKQSSLGTLEVPLFLSLFLSRTWRALF
jgi:cullin-associated NEDD8-dissociated protein 1